MLYALLKQAWGSADNNTYPSAVLQNGLAKFVGKIDISFAPRKYLPVCLTYIDNLDHLYLCRLVQGGQG
jgi:hypothetical protein